MRLELGNIKPAIDRVFGVQHKKAPAENPPHQVIFEASCSDDLHADEAWEYEVGPFAIVKGEEDKTFGDTLLRVQDSLGQDAQRIHDMPFTDGRVCTGKVNKRLRYGQLSVVSNNGSAPEVHSNLRTLQTQGPVVIDAAALDFGGPPAATIFSRIPGLGSLRSGNRK